MKIALTGAFGYSGKRIAQKLLDLGHEVVTLTNTRPNDDPFAGKIRVFPLNFNEPNQLCSAMEGCQVLINTYWVRFNYGNFTHEQAVLNSFALFAAAKQAGVHRIVHTSIANLTANSPFEYYRGKARIEENLVQTGLDYSILRPTVLFGENDILINNIAWTIRRFPVIGYFGNGQYCLRPIHVDDFSQLAVSETQKNENRIIDAVGPENYCYRDLLHLIARKLGKKRVIIRVPIFAGYFVTKIVGWYHRDVFLTRDEIGGLMANLLTSDEPSVGSVRLSDWLSEHVATIGKHYASELSRRLILKKG
ncbi:MAG: NAD(P)H-binding protein [Thermoguttaceae bacterium]